MYATVTIISCVLLISLVIITCSYLDYKKTKYDNKYLEDAKNEIIKLIKQTKNNQYYENIR